MSESATARIPENPIVLHHLNNSRSQRILWLLEELNLNYEIKYYQRQADLTAPSELKAIHPLGKSPVITDGKHTIAESGAIVEYLISRYGNGKWRPAEGTDEQLDYTYWLHTAEGSVMTPLFLILVFAQIREQAPYIARPIISIITREVTAKLMTPNLKANFGFIESHLAENEWFAGSEISGADVQMSFPIYAASVRIPEMLGEKTREWLQKVENRPAYKKALEKGGQYDMDM
ncbi:hypothetical protein Unana1_01643 [Umbelopsis nana]